MKSWSEKSVPPARTLTWPLPLLTCFTHGSKLFWIDKRIKSTTTTTTTIIMMMIIIIIIIIIIIMCLYGTWSMHT
uniref:Uncharacterized protein n=1 Tax=Octopus bimaculoides TaxID=37653 RepID=A0A0L8HWG6_OCTBM